MRLPTPLLIGLPLFCLTGCIATVDSLTTEPRYAKYVGTSHLLQRPCLLVKGSPSDMPNNLRYWLQEDGNFDPASVLRLRPGTPIRILEVNRYMIDGRGSWVGVVGVVKAEASGEVRFLYKWSEANDLHRAPWEPNTVPARRQWREYTTFGERHFE